MKLRGLFNAKVILFEEEKWDYLINSYQEKWVNMFLNCNSPKTNVIARLEFELAYNNFAVQYFNCYPTGTPHPKMLCFSKQFCYFTRVSKNFDYFGMCQFTARISRDQTSCSRGRYLLWLVVSRYLMCSHDLKCFAACVIWKLHRWTFNVV